MLKPLAEAHDLWAHATMTAAEFAYFFLARISEICAQDARNHAKYIVCRKHITFYKAGVECEWFEHPDEVAVWFPGSKTDQEMHGAYRSHFASGAELCVVNALVAWFAATHDLVPLSAPLFAVPLRTGGYTVLTRQAVADALKGAAVAHGEPASDYSTHSCRASGATSMMHCGHAETTISVAGRWAPNSQCVRGYTRYTRHLMAGISSEMATAVF